MSQGYDIFMDMLTALLSFELLVLAAVIAVFAGIVKGLVGFAMPMIMISGFASFTSPELALAGLIVPTLVTNVWQSLRQGFGAALASVKSFRMFLGFGLVTLLLSSQLVRVIPEGWMFLILGVPVVLFSISQLLGWRPKLSTRDRGVEAAVGSFAGFMGGMSGVWGPPTVAYLTAIDTPKIEHVRVQGVIYGLGSVALFGAHLQSGVLRAETLPFSIALCVPALLGIWLGFKLQDRIDQKVFRKITLAVLLIAGGNLIRRGVLA